MDKHLIEFVDKTGSKIIIRSVELSDGPNLIEYMGKTAEETRFLLREAGESLPTIEQEEAFLKSRIESDREEMLVAYDGDKLVGACSLMQIGANLRYLHRCGIAIALYREYWGRGIGRKMLEALLDIAKEVGYEQAELDVISTNDAAKALYEKLGFVKYGVFPNNVKYKDGTYADSEWMMKIL